MDFPLHGQNKFLEFQEVSRHFSSHLGEYARMKMLSAEKCTATATESETIEIKVGVPHIFVH